MRRTLPCLTLLLLLPVASSFAAAKKPAAKSADATEAGKPGQWKASTFAGLSLRNIGPAANSGRIADLAVMPGKPTVYYVASASGGVWKTTNGGITFASVFDHQGSYSIGAIAIDPNDPLVVWVGSGENNSQRSVSYGDGVYKSVDGGRSWENVGLKSSEHIGKIVVDPRGSDVVYVAAQGPLWSAGGDRGLYKTTDGGKTWKHILKISPDTGVSDLLLDPLHPDVLYAASYQRRRHVWTLVDGGPESAIYKSRDGGASWKKLSSGLPSEDMGRIGLALSPVDPNTIYATIEAARRESGFYRSKDGGANWEKRSSTVSSSPQYYQRLFADPKNVDRVYSIDLWVQVTDDGGRSFHNLGERNKHSDNHVVWIDPADTDHLLVGCDGGLYETYDRGAAWSFKANLPVTQFYRITADNSLPFYYVYGGTQDNFSLGGPSRTTNTQGILNADWFVTQGGDGFQSQVDPEDPTIVYAESQYGGLARFDRKSGESIDIQPQPPLGEALRFNWDSPIIISPHSHIRLYFGANRLLRSDDRGDSWRAVSPDVTRQIDRNKLPVMGRVQSVDAVAKNTSTSFYGNIVSIAESPRKDGLIYLGTDDGLIQVTTDGGAHWQKRDRFPGVPENTYVSRLNASQHDEATVYAAFDNHNMGDFKPYVLKSTDRGASWTSIAGDLPARGSVYALAEDPVDPNLLFAGTEFGLYFTTDGGQKWLRLSGGLPTIAVRDLSIQKREGDLVVATFGRGIYVLDDYRALRQLHPDALAKEAVLFPLRPALAYMEATPLGVPGKAFQGDSFFTAKNPPFGAVFTYYLKDDLLTRKARRARAEHDLLQSDTKGEEAENRGREKKEERKEADERDRRKEHGGDEKESGAAAGGAREEKEIGYPSWEELRAEDRETEPVVVLTVTDEDGNVIRRLTGPTTAGFHRIAWDLRLPPSEPTEEAPHELEVFETAPRGPLTAPGTYRAQLAKWVQGTVTPIGEPQTFTTVSLANATLPAPSQPALLAFERKVARLQRAVLGAVEAARIAKTNLDLAQKALFDTPKADPKMFDEARALSIRLRDLNETLNGDVTVASRSEPTPPAIVDRVQRIVGAQWGSSSAPTKTNEEAYTLAGQAFTKVLEDLRQLIDVDLKSLQSRMEAIGAPWTPGRVPVWTME